MDEKIESKIVNPQPGSTLYLLDADNKLSLQKYHKGSTSILDQSFLFEKYGEVMRIDQQILNGYIRSLMLEKGYRINFNINSLELGDGRGLMSFSHSGSKIEGGVLVAILKEAVDKINSHRTDESGNMFPPRSFPLIK